MYPYKNNYPAVVDQKCVAPALVQGTYMDE